MTSIDATEHHPLPTPARWRRLAGALVALLVATLAPALPAQAADVITISGRVNDQSDRPIPGLAVTVSPAGGGQARTATTASDGTSTVTGVPVGTTELSVDDDWASDDDLWRAQYWDGAAGVEHVATFSTGSASLTAVDFRLRPTSGIVGPAVDQAGRPLPKVSWDVYEYDEARAAGSAGSTDRA